MRNVALSAGIFASLTLVLGGCGNPMGPIAGGGLEGEVKPWPADWSFSAGIENVLLETNPEDPYSVTVWGVYLQDRFYVVGANEDSRWVAHLLKHGFCRLSVSGDLYAARASTVTDQTELENVLTAYVAKYEIESSEGENFIEDGGVLFRLTSR